VNKSHATQRFLVTLVASCAVLAGVQRLHAEDKPVSVIAAQRLTITTAKGKGQLPLYVSRDWTKPQPDVVRAFVIFHGKLRNADVYYASGQKALATAGEAGKHTILIAPQFLGQADVNEHHVPNDVLRWAPEAWMGGADATGPAPISSYTAIDAVLMQLADKTIFPNLKDVIIGGHSGGGQVVQRYAVVGRGESALVARGIHVRYVVANPSSYVYFSTDRPVLTSKLNDIHFAPFDAGSCKKFNHWKFGVEDPPPYIGDHSFTDMEAAYAHRDVIYLLGLDDTDPNHPELDKTCGAEAEGPYRLYRGTAYYRYMQSRHDNALTQQLWTVPGVGHDGDKMFNSSCGLAAVFDLGACTTQVH
jgi:pimeloyl-ACP methyl ester carboxylesterase